jgi:hypothetical protein
MDKRRLILRWLGVVLITVGAVLVVAGIALGPDSAERSPAAVMPTVSAMPSPTLTPEPIVPTRTVTPEATAHLPTRTPTLTPPPSSTHDPTVTATPTTVVGASSVVDIPLTATPSLTPSPLPEEGIPAATATVGAVHSSGSFVVPPHERHRLGVSLPFGAGRHYDLPALRVGWVMDWAVRASTALHPGIMYAQTARMTGGVLVPEPGVLESVARSRPGSLWLISNEADVRWQDNVAPDAYARLYHEAYHAIKRGDPTATVAAGGIAQPTELRLRYLDLALQAYQATHGQPLPAQAWHIHNYMLREERDSWGVDIPPGLSDHLGAQYSIADSGNVELFGAQIYAFRRWMASRGYGGQPLIISEFGIPMPADYGFPSEKVAAFLQETTRFMLTATDGALGSPSDGGRLVQRWCWFSMYYPHYPTGDLLDMQTGAWTTLAQAWMEMVRD